MENSKYTLTEKELDFVTRFFNANGCGAETFTELIGDNYSWQDMDGLKAIFPEYNEQQIGGFTSSLIQKGVLSFTDRSIEREFDKEMTDLFCIDTNYAEYRASLESEESEPATKDELSQSDGYIQRAYDLLEDWGCFKELSRTEKQSVYRELQQIKRETVSELMGKINSIERDMR